jgi:glycosyltransferase involved in cell wall biosynthesis
MGASFYSIGLSRGTNQGSDENTSLITLRSKPIIDQATKKILRFRIICILMRFIYYLEASLKLVRVGLKHKPRVIHAHDWFVLPAALLISKFTHSRLIYDAHELESEANGVSPELRCLTLLVERICWPRVDMFVTVSPAISEWYFRRFGDKKSRIILNSPINSSGIQNFSEIDSDQLRGKFNIPTGSKIFLSLGAIEKGRGVEILLEAFEKTDQNFYLIFMGQGTLAPVVQERSLRNKRILLHPQVPHASVTSIASSADYGLCIIENVSLSDWLCLPNKVTCNPLRLHGSANLSPINVFDNCI